MSEQIQLSTIRAFVSQWAALNEKDKVQLVNRTIQEKDPVKNIAIEACRLRDFVEQFRRGLGPEQGRLCFLMLITVARLQILGASLGYAFRGTTIANNIRVEIANLIAWDTLLEASRTLTNDEIELQYFHWTVRAIQKKQNPISAASLHSALQFIKDSSSSASHASK